MLASLRHLALKYQLNPQPAATSNSSTHSRQAGGAPPGQRDPQPRSNSSSSRQGGGILLFGHSMGGVVARAALQRAQEDPLLGKPEGC